MDKKTYQILIFLIGISVILVFFNLGGEISLELKGWEIVGGTGQLILLGVVGFLITKEAKKKQLN